MSTSISTWRDLIGELTAEQIAELEHCEREHVPAAPDDAEHRLVAARSMIDRNRAARRFAHIAPPADCDGQPGPWNRWDADLYSRVYSAWSRRVGEIGVEVMGTQFSDGRVQRDIFCGGMNRRSRRAATESGHRRIPVAAFLSRVTVGEWVVEGSFRLSAYTQQ